MSDHVQWFDDPSDGIADGHHARHYVSKAVYPSTSSLVKAAKLGLIQPEGIPLKATHRLRHSRWLLAKTYPGFLDFGK